LRHAGGIHLDHQGRPEAVDDGAGQAVCLGMAEPVKRPIEQPFADLQGAG
jgi:hypothetical protein